MGSELVKIQKAPETKGNGSILELSAYKRSVFHPNYVQYKKDNDEVKRRDEKANQIYEAVKQNYVK